MRCSFAKLALLFSAVSSLASAQISSLPTQENFLRRAFHSSTVRGNFLYIDGGEINQIDYSTGSAQSIVNTQNTTLSIDLRSSWTNASVAINSIDKGDAPVLNQEWLWNDPDGKTFYVFGGSNSPVVSRDAPDNNLWAFEADGQGGGSWSTHGTVPSSIGRTSGALVTGGNRNGIGYALGGNAAGAPVQGLIQYTMVTGSWANLSTTSLSSSGTAVYGQLVYTNVFGEDGILIALDGSDGTTGYSATLSDFSSIKVYDVKSGNWYDQQTSGVPPEARVTFCAVSAHSDSSLEIFLHGGFGGSTILAYDDVYVLSLPSFSWYKADYTPGVGRTLHTCNVNNGNMIVIGGTSSDTSWETGNDVTGTQSYRDPWPWGLGVFDMSNMQWASEFDPKLGPYTTPSLVTAGIAANGSEPSTWTSTELQQIFSITTLNQTSGSSNSSSGSGGSTPTPTPSPSAASSHGLSGGAIAGIAIGAVAVIVGIVAAAFLIRRSKRRSRSGHNPYPREEAGSYPVNHRAEGNRNSPSHAPLIEIDDSSTRPKHEKGLHGQPAEMGHGAGGLLPSQYVGGQQVHEKLGRGEEEDGQRWRHELP